MTHLSKLSFLCVYALVGGLVPAQAQAPGAAPGRVEQDIRRPPEPAPRPAIVVDRPRFAEQVPPGAERVGFTLGAVLVSGNTAIPTEQLAPLPCPIEAIAADIVGGGDPEDLGDFVGHPAT